MKEDVDRAGHCASRLTFHADARGLSSSSCAFFFLDPLLPDGYVLYGYFEEPVLLQEHTGRAAFCGSPLVL